MRKKGSVNYQYKIRKTGSNQQGSIIYGITIPNVIAEQFISTKFTIKLENDTIIFSSGCDIKIQSTDNTYFDKFTTKKEILK